MTHFTRPTTLVRTILLTASLAVVAIVTPTFGQSSRILQTEVRLEPGGPEGIPHDQFGLVVAASANGNTLAVTGTTTDNGPISEAGAIYIFDRIDNQWAQTARLFSADGVEDGQFAFTMALSEDGNTVVGAPLIHSGVFNQEGAVYVFHRSNGIWAQEAELLSPAPSARAIFGTWGLGINGDTLVAGDQGLFDMDGNVVPGVDVFTRVNGQWKFSTTIQLPNDPDFSPNTLTLNGGTLVVGAPFTFSGGAAFVFGLQNGSWALQAKLEPSDLTFGSQFGTTVAVDGSTVVVGAPSGPGASAFSGAVYVFSKKGAGWVQTAKLVAGDGVSFDQYGFGVDVNGGIIAVGAPSRTASPGSDSGAVYLYHLKDDTWSQFAEFTGSDVTGGSPFPPPGGEFGTSVALRNGTLLVGAPDQHPLPDHNPLYPEGEAYVYRIN